MWGSITFLLWAGAVAVLPMGTSCPSGDAIAAELNRLGAGAALSALGSSQVTIKDRTMHVVLLGRDGSLLGDREVAAPDDCNERAAVAAVFIAAWVGEWTTTPLVEGQDSLEASNHNTAALPPNVPRSRPRATEPTSRTSLPSGELAEVQRVAAPKPLEPTAAPSATKASAAPPAAVSLAETNPVDVVAKKPKLDPRGEVAGLGFGTYDGDAGTFGAGILVGYRLTGALVLGSLFEATGERERTLGPGLAVYRSFRVGVGASALRRWGAVFGDVGFFPELTLLSLNGKQLANERSATAWGAAADLRGRLGLTVGRVAPFLFVGGSYDLREERLTLYDRPQTIITLSRWNVNIGAGVAFLFGTKNR